MVSFYSPVFSQVLPCLNMCFLVFIHQHQVFDSNNCFHSNGFVQFHEKSNALKYSALHCIKLLSICTCLISYFFFLPTNSHLSFTSFCSTPVLILINHNSYTNQSPSSIYMMTFFHPSIQDAVYQDPNTDLYVNKICENVLEELGNLKKPFKYIVTCLLMQRNGAGIHVVGNT